MSQTQRGPSGRTGRIEVEIIGGVCERRPHKKEKGGEEVREAARAEVAAVVVVMEMHGGQRKSESAAVVVTVQHRYALWYRWCVRAPVSSAAATSVDHENLMIVASDIECEG